ncbi:hypothetical protein DPMN_036853 [Dreissena polymorpha]|uniref:Uncharacterized protein n=1 Tax=Dreissena polymorpha TaxID=45954 RepID=A0A9D4RP89_DREPO|nr:hypothetical protein DPMN_036853 [Dreissena polymorpha]
MEFKGCHRGGCQGLSLRGKTGRSRKWCLPNDRKQWCLRTDREFKGFNCGIVEMVKGCHRGVVEMVNGCHRGGGQGLSASGKINGYGLVVTGCHCGVVEIVRGCHCGLVEMVNGCHRGGGQGLSPLGSRNSVCGCHHGSCHHVVVEMGCHRGFLSSDREKKSFPGLSSWGSRNVFQRGGFQRGGGHGLSPYGRRNLKGFHRGMSMVVTVTEVNGFHRGGVEGLPPWGRRNGVCLVTERVVKGCHNWGCHCGVVEMLGMMERSSVATYREKLCLPTTGCNHGVIGGQGLSPWGMTKRSRKSLPNDREVKGCQRGGCQSGWKWCLTNDREKTDLRCPSNVYDRVYRLCQSQRDCNLNELQANLPQFTCKMYINVYMDHICIEVLTNPGFPGNHDWLPSTCYWAIYSDRDRGEEVVRIPWRELTFVILSTCSYVLEGMPICDTQYLQMRACH